MRGQVRAQALQSGDILPDGRGGSNRVAAVLSPVSILGRDRVGIKAGALGEDLPRNDIVVDPAQRIFVTSSVAGDLVGAKGAFVQAMELLGVAGVTLTPAVLSETVHVVFEHHGTLCSEGLCLEALVPSEAFTMSLDLDQSDILFAALPKLRYAAGLSAYVHDVPELDAREAASLIAAGVAFARSGRETKLTKTPVVTAMTDNTLQQGRGPVPVIGRAAATR
jgi:hypothetical protein